MKLPRTSALLFALVLAPATQASNSFVFKDGDRVVWIGNTFIEREQLSGYWETALTARYPTTHILFRNLGWSGDDVWGAAWASFDSVHVGFARRRDHVLALKPTVLIVGYGMNESFAGPAELPRFVQGLNTLLDCLAPTHARVVLLSPIRHEDMGRPLPDPAAHNPNLRLYSAAIGKIARKRGSFFVDLFDLLSRQSPGRHFTSNGIHLTPAGYRQSATLLEEGLGLQPSPWRLAVSADGKVIDARGMKVTRCEGSRLSFRVTDQFLPNEQSRVAQVRGLRPGKYTLQVDEKAIATADAARWAKGVHLARGPDFDQVEQLRQNIVEKNRLYFNRWRPENETYLFGFRKHEQGQNAVEIPRFDPLVAAREAVIAKLRVPVTHTYEWTPAKERGQ